MMIFARVINRFAIVALILLLSIIASISNCHAQIINTARETFVDGRMILQFYKPHLTLVLEKRDTSLVHTRNYPQAQGRIEKFVMYRGWVRSSIPSANNRAVLTEGLERGQRRITFEYDGHTYQGRSSRSTGKSEESEWLLFRVPKALSWGCLNDLYSSSSGQNPFQLGGQVSDKVYELELYIDSKFVDKLGQATQITIANIVNAADNFYLDSVGLTLKANITYLDEVITSATNLDQVLNQFANYMNIGNKLEFADGGHFLLGSDDGSPTAGLAMVGYVCRVPAFSYSISEYTPGASHILLAHELGHTLGAQHDPNGKGIMAAALSGSETSFSKYSIGELVDYIAEYGQCLAASASNVDDQLLSKLIGLTMSIKYKKKSKKAIFRAVVKDPFGLMSTGCEITLLGAKKAKNLKSFSKINSAAQIHKFNGIVFANSSEIKTQIKNLKATPSKASYYTLRIQCDGNDVLLANPKKLKPLAVGKKQSVGMFLKKLKLATFDN